MKFDSKHFDKHKKIYLVLILLLCLTIRFRFIDLCDVGDRGQVVLGMTNNLPPLFHYISLPFLYLTDNLWYSPAFGNLLLAVLSIFVLYLLGRDVKDSRFGLLLSFLFAIFPPAILVARYISPEQTELFFILLISYLFIRLEVLEKKENRSIFLVLYFFSLVVGAFSKQQTAFILFPIFIYGLYKYRLGIFRKEIYYISAFAVLPYVLFLFAHPEMLAAVVIYFIQPTGQMNIIEKFSGLALKYFSEALPYLFILLASLFFFVRNRMKKKEVLSGLSVFMMILFISYNLFMLKTLPGYFYLLSLPIIYYCASFVADGSRCLRISIITLLFAYCIFGFYLLVSGLSINTWDTCEQSVFDMRQNFILELAGRQKSSGSDFFQLNGQEITNILKNEKYIIIGGNTGQDLKYNIKKRMYYAGIINSKKYEEINYVLLVYPIDKAYTGAPAWDYGYLKFIQDHSEQVFNKSYIGTNLVMLRITNHSKEGLNVSDFRKRSLEGLKLNETILANTQ